MAGRNARPLNEPRVTLLPAPRLKGLGREVKPALPRSKEVYSGDGSINPLNPGTFWRRAVGKPFAETLIPIFPRIGQPPAMKFK